MIVEVMDMAQIADSEKKRISLVVPVYNESENIKAIYDRISALFSHSLAHYDLELIYSDNASTDDSFDQIRSLASQDARVRGIRLSRNFGFQPNVLSGIINATGDAVIQMDADGEDPPEIICDFVQKWEEGYQVVYGVRISRQESFFLTFQRRLFYRLLNKISNLKIPLDAGDFRLIDRCVANLIQNRFGERCLYLRGLISFSGFKQTGVNYHRHARKHGQSKFSIWSYASLAWDALTSFSHVPLKLVSSLGLAISLVSFTAMGAYFSLYWLGLIPVKGFTTLVLFMLFLTGVQLLSLGIVGEYICRIFDEVKQRPRTIVADSCGFTHPPREA